MVGSMLGDNILPESVQTQRRKVRSRVESLREPIRQRRQNMVPGPDIIGRAEDKFTGLKNTVVSSDSVLERIRDRRSDGSGGSGGSSGSSSSSSSNKSKSSSTDSSNSEMV